MVRLALAVAALLMAAACPAPVTEGPDAANSTSPDASAIATDGSHEESDAAVTQGDGAVVAPDGGLVSPDGAVVTPDGAIEESDAGGEGADAGPASSHGTGGLTCSSTGSVSVSGTSYSFCVATVAGVEMKIVEPEPGTGPVRLAVYTHGDGAGPYTSGLAIKKHAPWTTKHRVLYVAAKAPNGCAWWLKPSYTTCDGVTPIPETAVDVGGENAQALLAAIEALRAGWDVLDSPVLFGGSSGGSIFLSASFFPLHGDRFPGAYALSCGGDDPWAGSMAWDTTKPELVGATKLYFTYGDKDFVKPDVLDAIAYFQGLSLPMDVKVIAESVAEGASHCGNVGGSYSYDQIGRVGEVWTGYLGE
ncbi:MAG: hypothetical protein QM765_10380 [Myxococcales bacterium]